MRTQALKSQSVCCDCHISQGDKQLQLLGCNAPDKLSVFFLAFLVFLVIFYPAAAVRVMMVHVAIHSITR